MMEQVRAMLEILTAHNKVPVQVTATACFQSSFLSRCLGQHQVMTQYLDPWHPCGKTLERSQLWACPGLTQAAVDTWGENQQTYFEAFRFTWKAQ